MSGLTSRSAVEAALERAEQPEAAAIFTLRLDDEARALADAADALRAVSPSSPFLGVPITVKDNIDLAGHPTTAGSRLLGDAPPAAVDAPLVTRLRRAGFVVLGRTNMTEFAFSGLGLNPHFGTPANPAYPGEARIPGGSSSGAAVSVALGLAPAAIGTDTGGSIRIPAALCGLVGFKPTARLISRDGVLPLSTTLDGIGIIASQVATCAALFDVLSEAGAAGVRARPARLIRLGLVTNYVGGDIEPGVERAFEDALKILAQAGVAIDRLTIEALDSIPEMTSEATFPAAEAAAWHKPYLEASRADEYDPKILVRIRAGEAMTAPAYVRLHARRPAFIRAVLEQMAGYDALAWPTVPFLAPSIAALQDDTAYQAANARALRNSTIVNLMDGCAISLPCPNRSGGPVGITLAAPGGRDNLLLDISTTIETILKGS